MEYGLEDVYQQQQVISHHPTFTLLGSLFHTSATFNMRYTILAFAAGAAAAPFVTTGTSLCPAGLYSNPQCCATDVLGAIGLDCAVRTSPPFLFPEKRTNTSNTAATTPADVDAFISGCAAVGQQAKCCVIPIAGQDLLCQDVKGSGGAPGITATGGGGGGGTPTSVPGGGGGGATSTSCESSAVVTPPPQPTKPAPSYPTTTSDCGCGK